MCVRWREERDGEEIWMLFALTHGSIVVFAMLLCCCVAIVLPCWQLIFSILCRDNEMSLYVHGGGGGEDACWYYLFALQRVLFM